MYSEPPSTAITNPEDRRRRTHVRLWQFQILVATLLLTAWFCSLGGWGIALSLFIAKHVLVAVLAAGLHLPRE